MKGSLKASAECAATALAFASLLFWWAASPSRGAARPFSGGNEGAVVGQSARLPSPVGMREEGGRGLLVRAWVNGVGPYTFAVDTGAGANIISPRVAGAARVEVEAGGRGIQVGGLSG